MKRGFILQHISPTAIFGFNTSLLWWNHFGTFFRQKRKLTGISSSHQAHEAVVIHIVVSLQNAPLQFVQTYCVLWLWKGKTSIPAQSAKGLYIGCLVRTKKPTSEVELRDPGSSHLHRLDGTFRMRNRVTSSKPFLIFSFLIHHLRENIWFCSSVQFALGSNVVKHHLIREPTGAQFVRKNVGKVIIH